MNIDLSTYDRPVDSPDPLASSENATQAGANTDLDSSTSKGHERWSRLPKARGRQPKDPHAQSMKFQCRDTDDMENFLREYLDHPSAPAEHTTLEFAFPVSAAFMVYAADFKNVKKQGVKGEKQQPVYGKTDRTAISVIDALAPSEDPKDSMRRQKAIAKVCVEACERADGYRYSFHNNWLSREDEACRFSYFCNDSTLNKGRAANEGAGMLGKKMRKPVYDCQGLVAVKFSSTKQNLEVQYKHVPLHKTYAERAPPPRKESKRRKTIQALPSPNLLADKGTKKRKLMPLESPLTTKVRKRRITEPVVSASGRNAVDLTREDSLQPLVEFLGSANTLNTQNSPAVDQSLNSTRESTMNPGISRASTVALVAEKTSRLKPRRPLIPGTMAGSVKDGHLNWAQRSSVGSHSPAHGARTPSSQTTRLLPGIAEAAAPGTPSNATPVMSELEALKRKLEEAEERIKRLESEKTTTPLQPPQHVLWPPPPGYPPPPYPSYPLSSHDPPQTAPQPPYQQPLRFQVSPQGTFPPQPSGSANTTAKGRGANTPAVAASSSRPSPAQKSSQGRTLNTKFVLYTPGAKSKQTTKS